jgi:hypothetical protein
VFVEGFESWWGHVVRENIFNTMAEEPNREIEVRFLEIDKAHLWGELHL